MQVPCKHLQGGSTPSASLTTGQVCRLLPSGAGVDDEGERMRRTKRNLDIENAIPAEVLSAARECRRASRRGDFQQHCDSFMKLDRLMADAVRRNDMDGQEVCYVFGRYGS